MKTKFLSSVATMSIVAASLGASAAMAQQPGESAAAGGIEEVVVTAQRRSENVQKSSLAIEVVGADELARRGVSEARDLASITPSISVSQGGAFTQSNIRGAGDAALNGLREGAVLFSVDGVVIGQPLGISQNFYDLERVEILKGPQGTLYGRNATGGAVNLLTRRPTQQFGGYLTAEYGNFDNKRLTGAINIPLTNTLAVRGAFNIVDRDGYLSNGSDDDVRQSGRLQVYWEPSDVVNVRLFGDYSHMGGKGGGAVLFPKQPGTDDWTSINSPVNDAAIAAGSGGLHSAYLPDATRQDLGNWDLAAEINVRLGDFATLTVIPAYRNTYLNQVTYNFGFRAQFEPQRTQQFSYEARLSHESDKLKWVLGAYYFNDNSHFIINTFPLFAPVVPNFNTTGNVSRSLNRSYAAFGEATYSLTDRLRAIGGLRYTHDGVSIRGAYGDQLLGPVPQVGDRTYNALTWKVGAEYDVAPQSMAFVTLSRGYKSGGFFFIPDTSGDNSYLPEVLTAFDAGIRNRFFDNKLQVNLEAFYWRYENQQLSSVGFTSAGGIAYLTRNAGMSNPRGANLDVLWKPTPKDTVGFALSYTRARFNTFVSNFPAPLSFILRTGPLCSVPATPTVGPGGLPILPINCAGAPLPRTPEWSGTFSYEHIFQLADLGSLAANVSVTWATSRYLGIDFYVPEEKDGGYALLNADLTYTPDNGKWSITAFGRNLTEEASYQGGFADVVNGFVGPTTPTFVARQVGEPRVYGVRGTINF